MQLIELFLRHLGRCSHHDILRILVHRERNDLTDRIDASQQHNHAVHAGSNACVRWCAVAESIVHGGEFLFDIVFAKADHLKGLDHDLRIMVTDSAGRKLYAIADKVILVSCHIERIHLSPLDLQQGLKAAAGHGERIVAKLKLS